MEIKVKIIMKLKSGSWVAKECKLLVVNHPKFNLMVRDILRKLGLSFQQSNPKEHVTKITRRDYCSSLFSASG